MSLFEQSLYEPLASAPLGDDLPNLSQLSNSSNPDNSQSLSFPSSQIDPNLLTPYPTFPFSPSPQNFPMSLLPPSQSPPPPPFASLSQQQSQLQSLSQSMEDMAAAAGDDSQPNHVANPMLARFSQSSIDFMTKHLEQQPNLLATAGNFDPNFRLAMLNADPFLGKSMTVLFEHEGDDLVNNPTGNAILMLQLFHIYCFFANLWVPNPLPLPGLSSFFVAMRPDTWEAMRHWVQQLLATGDKLKVSQSERNGIERAIKRNTLQKITLKAFNFQIVTQVAPDTTLWAHPHFMPHQRPLFYAPLIHIAHDFGAFRKSFTDAADSKRQRPDPYRQLAPDAKIAKTPEFVTQAWWNAFWHKPMSGHDDSQMFSRLVRLSGDPQGQGRLIETLQLHVMDLTRAELRKSLESKGTELPIVMSAAMDPGGLFVLHESKKDIPRTVSPFSLADLDPTVRAAWQMEAARSAAQPLPVRFADREDLRSVPIQQWTSLNIWFIVCYQEATLVHIKDHLRQLLPQSQQIVVRFQQLLNVLVLSTRLDTQLNQAVQFKLNELNAYSALEELQSQYLLTPKPLMMLWTAAFLAGHPDIADDWSMTTVATLLRKLNWKEMSSTQESTQYAGDGQVIALALRLQAAKQSYATGPVYDPAWAAFFDSMRPNGTAFRCKSLYFNWGNWPKTTHKNVLYALLHPHGTFDFVDHIMSLPMTDPIDPDMPNDILIGLDAQGTMTLYLNPKKSYKDDTHPTNCPPEFVKWKASLPTNKWAKDIQPLLVARQAAAASPSSSSGLLIL
jgi:hypothetical protein